MQQQTLDDIKQKALPILQKARVKKAALFGSYVRGEQTEQSDIDLLVEMPESTTLFDLGGLKVDLEETLERKVDLVQYDTIKPRLKQYILAEQVPIL